VTFALKKPVENKTLVAWESRLDAPHCDITRCPKLDPIVEAVLRNGRGQPVVTTTEFYVGCNASTSDCLRGEEPDADRMSAAVQQALLFLGNTSAHFSQLRRSKNLKKLNPDAQSLGKDADFSQAAPYTCE